MAELRNSSAEDRRAERSRFSMARSVFGVLRIEASSLFSEMRIEKTRGDRCLRFSVELRKKIHRL